MSERAHEIIKTNLFTSFATWPPNLRFEHQEKNETVILFLRQHLITLVPMVVLGVIFVFAPMVIFPLFLKMLSTTIKMPVGYVIVGAIFWYVAVFGMLLAKFLYWFFNVYIVTDERVVGVGFINLFYRVVSTAKIEEIQDLSVRSSGAFETFFNYGSVFIQTAAQVSEFEFLRVPRPEVVAKVINQMIDQEEQEKLDGRVK